MPTSLTPHPLPSHQPGFPPRLLCAGKPVTTNIFPFQYAFNLFSHNSSMTDNGYNEEEMKLVGAWGCWAGCRRWQPLGQAWV